MQAGVQVVRLTGDPWQEILKTMTIKSLFLIAWFLWGLFSVPWP